MLSRVKTCKANQFRDLFRDGYVLAICSNDGVVTGENFCIVVAVVYQWSHSLNPIFLQAL